MKCKKIELAIYKKNYAHDQEGFIPSMEDGSALENQFL